MIYKRGTLSPDDTHLIDVDELELLDAIRATGSTGLKILAQDVSVARSIYLRDLIEPVEGQEWTYTATVKGRSLSVPDPAPVIQLSRYLAERAKTETSVDAESTEGDLEELAAIIEMWPRGRT